MNNPLLRWTPVLTLALLTCPLIAQPKKIQLPAASPAATVKQRVGLTDIEISYSRPSVKGRAVFGDAASGALELYGEVWRTGANQATKVSFSTALKFAGADVPAGTYALFTIPGKSEWTVILNKKVNQWGAYTYDAKDDLVRVKVAPKSLAESVETFTIGINDIRDDSATLNLIWDHVRVPVKLQFDIVGMVQPQIDAALAPDQKPNAGVYDAAALFYLDQGLDLNKAAQWIDAAIAQQPNAFFLWYHKARILAKQGDKPGAKAAAAKSIALAQNEKGPAKEEYTRLNETLLSGLGQ